MILADVFPVFCPRVLVPSSSPWSRCADRPEFRISKMWYNNNVNSSNNNNNSSSGVNNGYHHLNDEDFRRAFPNLRVPLPEKSFIGRDSHIKSLTFPESPFKVRSTTGITDPFKGFPSQSSILKAPSFAGHQMAHGDPNTSNISRYLSRSPFKSPSTVTELQLKSYKRGLDMREGKLSYSPEKRLCPTLPHHSHSLDMCGHKTMKLYRKQASGPAHNKKIYTCPQCKYVTDRKNNLKRHISTMHQDCSKVLDCCGMVFRSKALLRDHVSLFHRAGYRCQYCGRNFCRKALLRRHLTVHSGQKDFTCPQCGYATSHKSNLERHRKIHDRKFSVGGEGASDDTDSNEGTLYPGYDGPLSPVSSSTDSSPTVTPEKQSYCGYSEEVRPLTNGASQPRSIRGMFSDRLRETHVNDSISGFSLNVPERLAIPQSDNIEVCDVNPKCVSSLKRISSNVIGHQVSEFLTIPKLLREPNEPVRIDDVPSLTSSTNNAALTGYLKPKPQHFKKHYPKSSARLFPTPYKCYDCLAVFSNQRDFSLHNCKPAKPMTSSPPISVRERRNKFSDKIQTSMSYDRSIPTTETSESSQKIHTLNIPNAVNTSQADYNNKVGTESASPDFRSRGGSDESISKQDTSLPIKKRTIDDTKDN